MLVLMREDLALSRVLRSSRRSSATASPADGYHPTAPHPEGRGASRAIQTALRQAGVAPDEVDYVNSHGTGHGEERPGRDRRDQGRPRDDAAYKAAVSSTKSMIGHLLGGAGAVEAIVTVKAIDEQVAPPTANFTEADPECDLDYVPNEAREMTIDIALSNNFAFGGANASVLFARPGVRADGPPARNVDRAVITGLAALSTAGTDPGALYDAYAAGLRCTSAENGVELGRVDLAAEEHLSPKERKRVDRLGVFAVIASRLALANGGLELTDENRTRVGAIVGTGVGPMESMEEFAAPVIEEGAGGANPAVFPNTVYNAAGGQVAIKIGALGSASTVTAGHAAGASALCYGFDLTTMDHADAIVSIGVDTLTDTVIEAYKELGVVASSANGDSGGFALAEGGFAVLVERLGHASVRGATPYAEVLGYCVTSDACGIGRIDTEGDGIERAMVVMPSARGRVRCGRGDLGKPLRSASRRRRRVRCDRANVRIAATTRDGPKADARRADGRRRFAQRCASGERLAPMRTGARRVRCWSTAPPSAGRTLRSYSRPPHDRRRSPFRTRTRSRRLRRLPSLPRARRDADEPVSPVAAPFPGG